MRLSNIVRTATFRLAALYLAVFAVSVLLLGSFTYWVAEVALVGQFESGIEIEVNALQSEYRSGGIDGLRTGLPQRAASGTWLGFHYRVVLPDGTRLGEPLPQVPIGKVGWHRTDRTGDHHDRSLTTLTARIENGALLTVGRSPMAIYSVEDAILETFLWALGAIVVVGGAGGVFISSRFLERIDAISSTTQSIIEGNYRERMPVLGTNDDIDRLSRTLNVMLDHIGELMESLQQVANDIAHDLRTPLSRMRQRLENAQTNEHDAGRLREAIASAIDETDSILDTFSALLRIAQIEAGTRRSAFTTVDLSELVTDVADAYAPPLKDEGRILECQVEPALRLSGDADLITQLVANLIENAARHTPKGTRITVSAARQANAILLGVADNGPGVPEALRQHVFKRFYRLEASRSTPGSGLGLSLVKSICTLHDANIELKDNHPGLRVEIEFSQQQA
ncbi:MAG: sensor histidine kinase [Hyphomicrobiaceae bacterium]